MIAQPDLAALVRRARSAEPGAGLSSAAAMAALLAQPPRPSQSSAHLVRDPDESDSGWLRRLRDRREDDADDEDDVVIPRRLGIGGLPPAPGARTDDDLGLDEAFDDHGNDDHGYDDHGYDDHGYDDHEHDPDGYATGDDRPARRRLLVIGLPLLALAVVVLLAWWFGTKVLSVADPAGGTGGSTPPPSASASEDTAAGDTPPPVDAPAAVIASGTLYDPQGDGEPENPADVPLTFDGDPATSWSTVTYRGSAAFGGLKDGMGVVYDLGGDQALAAVTITTNTPGATMEVRVGGGPDTDIAPWTVAASGTIDGTTELAFDEPVSTRYLLVWVTSLAESEGGFTADIAEVGLRAAG